jgi:hypothetical protein
MTHCLGKVLKQPFATSIKCARTLQRQALNSCIASIDLTYSMMMIRRVSPAGKFTSADQQLLQLMNIARLVSRPRYVIK